MSYVFAGSSNGRIAVSETVHLGSNPSPAALRFASQTSGPSADLFESVEGNERSDYKISANRAKRGVVK